MLNIKIGFLTTTKTLLACDCGVNGTCSFDENGEKKCDCTEKFVLKNGTCVGKYKNNSYLGNINKLCFIKFFSYLCHLSRQVKYFFTILTKSDY